MFHWAQKKLIISIAIIFTLFHLGTANATPVPQSYFVMDNANVLSAQTKAHVAQLLAKEQNHFLVVATTPDLNGLSIEEYSINLARTHQFGETGKDNGVLLLLAPTENLARIEVGYGLEGTLTDAVSATILSQMEPYLKQRDFNNAVLIGTTQILNVLKPVITRPQTTDVPLTPVKWIAFVLVVLLFVWVGFAPHEDRARRLRFILFLLSFMPGRSGFKGRGGRFGGGGASRKF